MIRAKKTRPHFIPLAGSISLTAVIIFFSLTSNYSLAARSILKIKVRNVKLSTSTPGGGFELFGKTLAKVVNRRQAEIHIRALPSRGSRQNLKLLLEGKTDIALVEGNAAQQAFQNSDKSSRPAILHAMYPNPGMFVVRADSNYRTIGDLKGKKIAFGTKASGLVILARNILSGLNLDMEKNFQAVYLKAAREGPKLLLEGKVEAFWGAGIGWPGFVKVADSKTGGRFIAPDSKQIQRILKKHPFLRPMTIPANTYRGQKKDIHSVGLWSFILVRKDISELTVYKLSQAIHKAETELAKRLLQGKYSTLKNTFLEASRARLHPGVRRHLKEQGLR